MPGRGKKLQKETNSPTFAKGQPQLPPRLLGILCASGPSLWHTYQPHSSNLFQTLFLLLKAWDQNTITTMTTTAERESRATDTVNSPLGRIPLTLKLQMKNGSSIEAKVASTVLESRSDFTAGAFNHGKVSDRQWMQNTSSLGAASVFHPSQSLLHLLSACTMCSMNIYWIKETALQCGEWPRIWSQPPHPDSGRCRLLSILWASISTVVNGWSPEKQRVVYFLKQVKEHTPLPRLLISTRRNNHLL